MLIVERWLVGPICIRHVRCVALDADSCRELEMTDVDAGILPTENENLVPMNLFCFTGMLFESRRYTKRPFNHRIYGY